MHVKYSAQSLAYINYLLYGSYDRINSTRLIMKNIISSRFPLSRGRLAAIFINQHYLVSETVGHKGGVSLFKFRKNKALKMVKTGLLTILSYYICLVTQSVFIIGLIWNRMRLYNKLEKQGLFFFSLQYFVLEFFKCILK